MNADDLFACRECEQRKPREQMFSVHKAAPKGWCRECRGVYRRAYYAANREAALASSAKWKQANRSRWHDALRKSKYGLEYGAYAQMLEEQKGVCAICASPPGARSLHVDHDHKTGQVRALLCDNCNRGIGHLKEDVGIMRAAIAYIQEHAA